MHCASMSVPPLTAGRPHCSSITVPSRNTRTVYCSDRSVPLLPTGTVHFSDNTVPLLTTGTVHYSVDPVPLVTSVAHCSIETRELDIGTERRIMDEGKKNRDKDEKFRPETLKEGQELSKVGQVKRELGRVIPQEAGAGGREYGKRNREMSHGKSVGSHEVNPEIGLVAQGNRLAEHLPVNCSDFRSVKVEEPRPQTDKVNKICAVMRDDDDLVQREPCDAKQRGEESDAVWSRLTGPTRHGPSPPVQRENTSGADEPTKGNDDPKVDKVSRRSLRRRKKKEAPQPGRNSSRRERKVTKTLAVVLGTQDFYRAPHKFGGR